jgi:hypothetical protein
MSGLNVRFDREMAALLERVACQSGRKSKVVRDALEMLRAQGTQGAAKPRAETLAGLTDAGTAAGRGFLTAPAHAWRD